MLWTNAILINIPDRQTRMIIIPPDFAPPGGAHANVPTRADRSVVPRVFVSPASICSQ